MFICERACIYACVRCFPSLSSTLPFEKGHFTESELHLLASLAGQWTPGCFCLCLPRVGVTEGHPRACLFMWVLRSNSSSHDWIPNRLLLKPSLPLLINHFLIPCWTWDAIQNSDQSVWQKQWSSEEMSPAIAAVGSRLLCLVLLLKCQEGIQGDQAVRGHGESWKCQFFIHHCWMLPCRTHFSVHQLSYIAEY